MPFNPYFSKPEEVAVIAEEKLNDSRSRIGAEQKRGGGSNGRKSFVQFCLPSALQMFLTQASA